MAKGGKGRKGGGGGGGKTRKYSRDNNGRFASTGTGATARGGRLLTAKGNKRTARALAGKTKTITAAGQKGVLAKPKGLKPGAIKPKPAANKVVVSPRRLSGDQKIARDVMTNKKLTSDRQRVAEMQRRGIKPGTDMVGLVAGVRAKQGGDSTARIKPAAKPAAARAAAAKPATKLPREQRLARARVTAKRIDQKLQAKADETGAAFAKRRRISSRASSKARTAAFEKEAVAGKASATASRASQRSNARVTRLAEEQGKYAQPARGAATKPATKSPEPAVKIAKRKPKTPAEIAAGREADRREMASILRKPARWLTPTLAAKPARFSASELAERKGYAKQLMAQPKGVRKANYLQRKAQKNPDQLDRFKGRMKFGTQNTINNITEGRSYLTAKKSQFANTPEKRASIERSVTNSGRSLQARMKTTNLGTRLRRLNKPVTTKAAKIKGTISKPKGLKPGNIKPKAAAKPATKRAVPNTVLSSKPKRVLVKANARPENLFSRATKKTPGYNKTDAKANVANARRTAEAGGATTGLKSNKRDRTIASVNSKEPTKINFNASNSHFKNPIASQIAERRANFASTAKAGHTVAHELGHLKHNPMKMAGNWDAQLRSKGQIYADANKVVGAQRLATRVSRYARTQPAEFAAETRAALSLGKKYDSKVMGLYRSVTGTKLPSVRSQVRAQGVKGAFVSPRVKSKPNRKPRSMR